MNAVAVRFYVHRPREHNKQLLYEWLLERAKEMGIHGGSAFLATAGYGRHGVILDTEHDPEHVSVARAQRNNLAPFVVATIGHHLHSLPDTQNFFRHEHVLSRRAIIASPRRTMMPPAASERTSLLFPARRGVARAYDLGTRRIAS